MTATYWQSLSKMKDQHPRAQQRLPVVLYPAPAVAPRFLSSPLHRSVQLEASMSLSPPPSPRAWTGSAYSEWSQSVKVMIRRYQMQVEASHRERGSLGVTSGDEEESIDAIGIVLQNQGSEGSKLEMYLCSDYLVPLVPKLPICRMFTKKGNDRQPRDRHGILRT